jgi:flagellar M-ring protein FliF
VVVTLRAGARLSASNGAAITHLVASAVERLAPEAVTVLDSRGNLLVKPRKAAGPGEDVPEVDMEYRQKVERDLVAKVHSTLEPLLGAEKFRASASVDLDFTSGDLSEETFDPTRSVMTASQKTEDMSGTGLAGGAAGTASNLPNPPARAGSGSGTARKTENISYQTSRVVKHTKIPQGALRRMSVAILLDQNVRWEGTGARARRVLEPPSAEKIKTIRDLVAAATGYSEERGDQITVETLPFEATLGIEPPAAPAPAPATPPAGGLPAWLRKYAGKAPVSLLIGAAVAAALVAIAAVALLVLRRKKPAKAKATSQKAISEGGDAAAAFEGQLASRAASQERLEAEALLALKLPPPGTKKSEILAKHLKKSAKRRARRCCGSSRRARSRSWGGRSRG